MTDNQLIAIKMLNQFSKRYDIWSLMGPALSSQRQDMMTLLIGKKLPKAKCGVTAIREEFWKLADITDKGSCIAARDDLFAEWCKQHNPEHQDNLKSSCIR